MSKIDLSASDLGGIRKRTIPPNTPPAVAGAVDEIERFEQATGTKITGVAKDKNGNLTMSVSLPDDPPTRKQKRQTEIPGAEAPSIPDLDNAIRVYLEDKAALDEAKEILDEAKGEVQAQLTEHRLVAYHYTDAGVEYVAELGCTETIKVRKVKGEMDTNG